MAIKFFTQDITIKLDQKKKLKDFIAKVVTERNRTLGSLNYIFCSDEYLLEINRAYLQHDYYTDIITFEFPVHQNEVAGEIYISVERVAENALSYDVSFRQELHRVIFHGVLHLLGFKDKLKAEKLAMTNEEDRLLKLYFDKN